MHKYVGWSWWLCWSLSAALLNSPVARAEVLEIWEGQSFRSAVQDLRPGDTLIVHSGVYVDEGRVAIRVQGSAEAPVVIQGAGGEPPPLISRLATSPIQNSINIDGAAFVTLRGFEISGNGGDGIRLNSAPSNITLEDLVIRDVVNGIALRSSMRNVTIRRCEIHRTGAAGGSGTGIVSGCPTCVIADLLVERTWIHHTDGSTGAGIELLRGTHASTIRDNTVHDTKSVGILLFATDGRPRNLVEGNALWGCGEAAIQATAEAVVRNNLLLESAEAGFQSFPRGGLDPHSLEFIHNTVVGGKPCIDLRGWDGRPGMVFANNAVYCSPGESGNFVVAGLTGAVVTGNVIVPAASDFPRSGYVVGRSALEDFLDVETRNVYPSPDSWLIDAADPFVAATVDFNGTLRTGQPEAGAYTWTESTNPGWAIGPGIKVSGLDDCDANGVSDLDEIAEGLVGDCNANRIPDDCEVRDGTARDCDGNGVPDACQLREGTTADCNANEIPDTCELTANDCNGNGAPDECDLAATTSLDCDGNGQPDECQADCDGDGVPDACELTGSRVLHIHEGDSFEDAVESLRAGDTLVVHSGTYLDDGRISIGVKGTLRSPVVVRGAPGEMRPLISRPAEAPVQNTINIEGARFLIVKGLEISGNGGDGVRLHRGPGGESPAYVVLEDLEIHDVDVGINLRTDMHNITIRRNHIHRTGAAEGTGEGIYVGCNLSECAVSHCLIEGNWIHDTRTSTQGDGIEMKRGSHSNSVRDNIVYDTGLPGILVYGTDGMPPNVIESNFLANCLDAGIQAAADAIIRNNVIINSEQGFVSRDHQGATPTNLEFTHNTVVGGDPCIRLSSWSDKKGLVFANNAIYCANGRMSVGGLRGVAVEGNIISPATDVVPQDGYRVGRLGLLDFVDPWLWNLYPTPDSPVIDAGSLRYAAPVDFDGTPRTGAPEAGAYAWTGRTNPGGRVTAGFKRRGPLEDCNGNGYADSCDIEWETSEDCNFNGIPDECDIESGFSRDDDADGFADDCEEVRSTPFVRGDCNGDGVVGGSVSDAVSILQYLFQRGTASCLAACDGNGDDCLDVSDPVYLLVYGFIGGKPPPPPFPGCGRGGLNLLVKCEVSPKACQ